jgi:GNAT superfamily N-acetyltransferase
MQTFDTQIQDFVIRYTTKEDIGLIFYFIKQLAEYEHLSDAVVATEDGLLESIFVQKRAQVLIAEYKKKPVGFALFFYNYSTFLGRANIYLEDLFIEEKYRGNGFGKAIFSVLAQICVKQNCGRLDWSVLNWNKPSIAFYESLGAKPILDWTVYRLEGEKLSALANK